MCSVIPATDFAGLGRLSQIFLRSMIPFAVGGFGRIVQGDSRRGSSIWPFQPKWGSNLSRAPRQVCEWTVVRSLFERVKTSAQIERCDRQGMLLDGAVEKGQPAVIEAHQPGTDKVHRDRIRAGQQNARWLRPWVEGTVSLAAHDSIDDAEEAPLRTVVKRTFGVSVEENAIQVEYHSPGRVVSVPVARTDRAGVGTPERGASPAFSPVARRKNGTVRGEESDA